MAILPAMRLEGAVPAVEAARALRLSAQRVRALVAEGSLPGIKVAGRWLVERGAVERRLREPGVSGRPFSPGHAWGLIDLAEGGRAAWLDAVARSRLRRILRERGLRDIAPGLVHRGRRLELRAHPSDLARIEQEPDVVLGGVSAALQHRLEIVAPNFLEAYIPARRWMELRKRYRLKPGPGVNLVLRIIDGPWPFAPGQRVAHRLAAAVDLIDHEDERSHRAGLRALQAIAPRP